MFTDLVIKSLCFNVDSKTLYVYVMCVLGGMCKRTHYTGKNPSVKQRLKQIREENFLVTIILFHLSTNFMKHVMNINNLRVRNI